MKPLFNKDRSINLPGYEINQEVMPGLLKRCAAFVIDAYIGVVVFLLPFNELILRFSPKKPSLFGTTGLSSEMLIISSFFLFMLFFYLTLSQYAFGQSIGMMILKFKAKNKNGGSLTLWQSFVRNLYVFPLLPLGFIWSLELLHMLFFHYRLLERLSNTYSSSQSQINHTQ